MPTLFTQLRLIISRFKLSLEHAPNLVWNWHLLFTIPFLLFTPFIVLAVFFERDLYYGILNDPEITKLQEFLLDEKVYDGPVTGNFLILTKEGVKNFQVREGIEPVLGYFGPKTRQRVNEILAKKFDAPPAVSEEKLIANLLLQIQALQAQISALQQKLSPVVKEPSTTPSAKIFTPPAEETLIVSESEPEPKEFRVSGGADLKLPVGYESPLKIGDIVIKNTTDNKILLSQIVLIVSDSMNSSLNRGSDSYLVIRDGISLTDNEISKTKFTFNSTVPNPASPHTVEIGISYPVEIASGAEKKIGLWIELLEYIEGGKLEFEFKNLLATSSISPVGGFKFTLTK
jgi:hypothetical protein